MSKFRVTAKSGLNIRSGPGKEYADLGDLAFGDQVVSPNIEGWLPILLEDNAIGWVGKGYLEENQTQQKPNDNLGKNAEKAPQFPGPLKTSSRGLEFIKSEEGCVLHVYKDPAGYPTIGAGHLIKEGEKFGEITEEEALELLAQDLKVAEDAINKFVRVPLSQNQFDALASFTFNCGVGALKKSTLLRLLNEGRYETVPGELTKWVKAGGQTMPGLVKRRQHEATLWGETAPPIQTSPASQSPSIAAREYPAIGKTGKWKGIIGQAFTPESFRAYVQSLAWGDWRPKFIVLHNTGEPCLANRPQGLTQQHIQNLATYYRDTQGWSAGPHLFIDDRQIWVFTPLTTPGVHANSWNNRTIGFEMLGDYDREEFDSGRGAQVKANAVAAVAILSQVLGIDPESMMFHQENGETTHHCPGDKVDKEEFIRLVKEVIKR